MTGLCVDCWNRIHSMDLKEEDVMVCKDLCNGCGEWRHVVVIHKNTSVIKDYVKNLITVKY